MLWLVRAMGSGRYTGLLISIQDTDSPFIFVPALKVSLRCPKHSSDISRRLLFNNHPSFHPAWLWLGMKVTNTCTLYRTNFAHQLVKVTRAREVNRPSYWSDGCDTTTSSNLNSDSGVAVCKIGAAQILTMRMIDWGDFQVSPSPAIGSRTVLVLTCRLQRRAAASPPFRVEGRMGMRCTCRRRRR